VWQLVTYMFMHGSIFHLGANLWALFVFGRGVEWAIGKTKFLILYFSSGIIGGLVQALASMLWPAYIGGATLGASAGVFGVVAAFAMFFPEQPLVMLLFFVIPVKMRAKSLLWFLLVISAYGISFYNSPIVTKLLGKNVAHFAHLGGILTGIAFARIYFRWREPPSLPAE
jgi:membrane associated rhomboid family serine protease